MKSCFSATLQISPFMFYHLIYKEVMMMFRKKHFFFTKISIFPQFYHITIFLPFLPFHHFAIFLPFYHFCSSPQAFSSNITDAERQHGRHPGLPRQQALRRVSLDNSVRCNLQVLQSFFRSDLSKVRLYQVILLPGQTYNRSDFYQIWLKLDQTFTRTDFFQITLLLGQTFTR